MKSIIFFMTFFSFLYSFSFSYSETEENLPEKFQKFTDVNTEDFIQDLLHNKMPDTVISQPDEYTDVVKMEKSAVPYLIKLLNDPRGYVRIASLLALEEITKKQFGEISDFADQNDSGVNWGVGANSSKVNGRAINSNLNSTRQVNYSSKLDVRYENKMEAIVKWNSWWEKNKNKSRIRWLIDDLDDPNELVKKEAVMELGILKNKSVVNDLKKHSNDAELRPYIEQALKEINSK